MDSEVFKYGLLASIIIGWTLNPFMKRQAMGNLSGFDYFVVNFILTGFFAALVWVLLVKMGKCQVNVFRPMKPVQIAWALGASIITVMTGISFIYLVKNYEVGTILPQVQPGVIVLTVMTGYCLFGESLSIWKGVGVGCIILGMVLINRDKVVKVGRRPWR